MTTSYYLIIFVLLILIELIYFKIARIYQILDIPNHRSSHQKPVIRGGGIIFPIAILFYFFINDFQFPYFVLGLISIASISFIDDIKTVGKRIRMLTHLVAVLLIFQEINSWITLTWWIPAIVFICIGIINTFNFMDGINGITVSYGLTIVISLIWVNIFHDNFIPLDLLLITAISLLVLSIFNFRNQALCFAGDVGSVSLAFILIFFLFVLCLKTQNLGYLFFFIVYGIDTSMTIARRLYLKENIFEPHRQHLFQLLKNELGINALYISIAYSTVQLAVNTIIIWSMKQDLFHEYLIIGCLTILLISVYWGIRLFITRQRV
ncbi:MraY family glycosyltransferase [Emticicia sp. SJ17W-69]|uniref:MraY family glycosyltransferase n=1 Tax=Emticicia sp. SJ17W-69 TaxID=3421657 RepID=UPI003EBF8A85